MDVRPNGGEVRARFQRRRRWYRGLQLVAFALLALELYEFTAYPPGSGTHRTGYVALVAMLGICAAAIAIWRCPSCSGYLQSLNPRFCPRCGIQLRD